MGGKIRDWPHSKENLNTFLQVETSQAMFQYNLSAVRENKNLKANKICQLGNFRILH